jgi:hypothetical protein
MTLDAPGPFGSTCRTPTLTWSASTDATPPWAARPVSSPPRPQPGCPLTGAVVVLTSGNDTRSGTPGTNIMFGLDGADVLRGLAGDDCLYGDAGSDRLLGGRGRDRLFGGAGADVLSDARGRDTFSGGTGNDRIDARDETRSGRRIADAVSCGRGLRDVALVDRADRVRRDCERVRRRQ